MRTIALLVTLIAPLAAVAAEGDVCRGRGTSIYVRASDHSLLLCENNATHKSYSVALGRGGTGKRKQGDLKTPLGAYSLGTPRVSKKFGLFIPIGYPTAAQRKAGFTGSDVGIHGPTRRFAWAGSLNNLVDWTQGCIAVASDEAIEEVATWVRARKPKTIDIGE